MAALTLRIATRLIHRLTGIDCDLDRLSSAVARGIETGTLPVASGTVGLVTCFGALAYLSLYDQVLAETARVLEDEGWFLFCAMRHSAGTPVGSRPGAVGS